MPEREPRASSQRSNDRQVQQKLKLLTRLVNTILRTYTIAKSESHRLSNPKTFERQHLKQKLIVIMFRVPQRRIPKQ